MALLDMKAIERRAADLVVAELGAVRWELRDTGTLGAQMRDYDIVFADGHEEPLEVTTSADPLVLTAMGRMEGKTEIPADVKRAWFVSAPYTYTDSAGEKRAFDQRRCVQVLVPFVEQLERDGRGRSGTTSARRQPGEARSLSGRLAPAPLRDARVGDREPLLGSPDRRSRRNASSTAAAGPA